MELNKIKSSLPQNLYNILSGEISELRPAQEKALKAGLLEGESLLACTPTASGKTLIAELAMLNNIYTRKGKAVYIVPLKALAGEKYRYFSNKYKDVRCALSVGDVDSKEQHLANYDMIITTSEKLDSLTRHHTPWLREIKTLVVDEIHLLNDPGRGPTLEIIITLLRQMLPSIQLIGLSATIGNANELAGWLNSKLIIDEWRPVELFYGVMSENKVEFH
ncbi:MAG: DEAD/DEAH box helicase [Candidatus Nanoarchaeia archaeon]